LAGNQQHGCGQMISRGGSWTRNVGTLPTEKSEGGQEKARLKNGGEGSTSETKKSKGFYRVKKPRPKGILLSKGLTGQRPDLDKKESICRKKKTEKKKVGH